MLVQKRKEDIINDVRYAEANAMLVHINEEGNDGVNHKEPISNVNIHTKKNELNKKCFFLLLISSSNTHTHENVLLRKNNDKVD